jgi:hypothetical protein
MKTLHYTFFLASIAIILSCCTKTDEPSSGFPDPSVDVYFLSISFKDGSGNDLVAPLGDEKWKQPGDISYWSGEINPDRYNLDIVSSSPLETTSHPNHIPANTRPYFLMDKFDENYKIIEEGDGIWYLSNETQWNGRSGIQEYLTYKITCPTIFGDSSIHELVAWWDKDPFVAEHSKDRNTGALYPECKKATFDGKDYSVKQVKIENGVWTFYGYFIDIVLDR